MSEEVERARRPRGSISARNVQVFKIEDDDSHSTPPRRFKLDTEEDDESVCGDMSAGLPSDNHRLSVRSLVSTDDEKSDKGIKKKLANILF